MTARQGDHLPGIEFQQSESDHERENNRFGPAEKGDRYDDFKKDGKYGGRSIHIWCREKSADDIFEEVINQFENKIGVD